MGRATTAWGVVIGLLCFCLVAAVLGSGPLVDWTQHVADRTGWTGPARLAEAWHGGLEQIGVTKPYATVRQGVRAAEQQGFDQSQSPAGAD